MSQVGVCYGAVTTASANFHVLAHTSLYLMLHEIMDQRISMDFCTSDSGTQSLTSGMFLLAVAEEEIFWRIIHELCTAQPEHLMEEGIAVKVWRSHWILKSIFSNSYSISRVFW